MMIQLYETIPEIKCLQGDTLPEFHITLENASDFTEMYIVLESPEFPGTAILSKTGTLTEAGFFVQLTSGETQDLSGSYRFHICLTDGNGLKYKKTAGILNVIPVAERS